MRYNIGGYEKAAPARWSRAYYEKHALKEAYRTTDPNERRKHLSIGQQARMVAVPSLPSPLVENLKLSYEEMAELVDPQFSKTAADIAALAISIGQLRRTRGSNRLFFLSEGETEARVSTLFRVHPARLDDSIRTLFGIDRTDDGVRIYVNRAEELVVQREAEGDVVYSRPALIADIPYPWRMNATREGLAPSQPWCGTLVVGSRAISEWSREEIARESSQDRDFARRCLEIVTSK